MSKHKLRTPPRMFVLRRSFAEEGRYGGQSTHVTYVTQSAHTYQSAGAGQTQPAPGAGTFPRDQPATSSSGYAATPAAAAGAPGQSAFSSYPSHYAVAAHAQKPMNDAHFQAGYRLAAPQPGTHGAVPFSHLLTTPDFCRIGQIVLRD